ncbi:MAG TPA: glycosyltransferase family A protein [Opitutaceae bacterium]|jgi:hypothetical protein|nr:glycosyltransferase family A protein [Opitutaceae bacterium]
MNTTGQSRRISFCTTCSNRLNQLSQVFDKNSKAASEEIDIEWVVLNFGSLDGLHEFMLERLPSSSNRIVYAQELSGRSWHSCIAKNAAHQIATGDILVNLDCDNLIGDAIQIIRDYFSQGCQALHLWSGVFGDGTYGRIAILRKLFYDLGGYDESFYPMGYQDTDLLKRASALGIPALHSRCSAAFAIKNTKDDSTRSCAQKGHSWRDFNRMNKELSFANIANGKLVANAITGLQYPNVRLFRGGRDTSEKRPRDL